jgi:DNA-binding transcriptional LysR family regulator
MRVDSLIEFVTVARTGSITNAAERLSMSQSSLSRHLGDLETTLGLKLMERLPNGIELTEAGHYVYSKAIDIADIVDDIAFYASQRAKSSRTMSIGGVLVLPAYMEAFCSAATEMERAWQDQLQRIAADPLLSEDARRRGKLPFSSLKLKFPSAAELGGRDTGEMLDKGDLDACLLRPVQLTEELHERFVVEKFADERLVAIMNPSNALAARTSISIDDLEGTTLLHSDSYQDFAHYAWLELKALLRERGVTYRAKARELNDESDWITGTREGIVVLTASHRIVPILRACGRACVPIDGTHYTFYSVHRASDGVAEELVSRACALLSAPSISY